MKEGNRFDKSKKWEGWREGGCNNNSIIGQGQEV